MKPVRLLITEDEMIVALDLERRLRKLGYEICGCVSTGEQAVTEAAALRPDLVLMDICLAGEMDGIEAATRIRDACDIPIIYLTANADEQTLQRVQATHAASYLLKPFRERELQIAVELGLTNHRLRQELKAAHDVLEQRVEQRTAELAATNTALRAEMAAREKAEAQFLRAQRLESVGALASGIAHDLNNVFTPLMMCAQALQDAAPGTDHAHLGDIILSSSRRGADMVRQIVLFVRGTAGERAAFHLEHLVSEVHKLLRDTLPREIRIRTRFEAGVQPILADATQLHQLLMNLCVNARDAMPDGGDLTIALENARADSAFFRQHSDAKGQYVRLTVSDTGTGMPPEVMARLFTPFFTTKELGKGTGLGLSTVQSIVRAHAGFIDVESKPGAGTRFDVHLPAGAEAETPSAAAETERPAGDGELILFVDDEASVREMARATLEAYGYRVLLAQDGVDAIARFAGNAQEIGCVVTDLEMPYLNGVGCIRGIRRLEPEVPVVLLSGSGDRRMPSALADEHGCEFLHKPFTQAQLLSAVRRRITAPVRPAPSA